MPDRARELADAQAGELIDLLRAATTLLYSATLRPNLGRAGEAARVVRDTYLLADDLSAFQWTMDVAGPVVEVELSNDAIRKIRTSGLLAFGEVLSTSPALRTPFEAALMTALHWYGDATAQNLPANQLLSLCVALETIFTGPREGQIRFHLSEGVAFVLEDDAEKRHQVRATVAQLYAKRGAVAHTGSQAITTSDVHDLRNLTMGVLLSLVGRRSDFSTIQELARWIDDLRLA